MSRSHSLSLRLAVALLLAGVPLCARADGEASLTIRLATSSTQFKVGQTIPLELTFSASGAKAFLFSTASYDRSGRLGTEQYEVTPNGRDPLYAYYHNPLQVYSMGGLSSSMPLNNEPQVLHRDLNEWVALDKPGHYSLRVLSGRVGQPAGSSGDPKPLVSNALTIDIVNSDAAWQKRTLSEAVSLLDDGATPQEDRDKAERTLRYLDCPESIHELARRITEPGQEDQWNFTAGLLGARDQALVLQELEARFDAPDAALTQNYLFLLGEIHFAHTHPPLPPYPVKDVTEQRRWESKRGALLDDLTRADDELYQRVVDTLPNKQGRAKLETIATLLRRPDGPHKLIEPSASEIAASFPLLDPRQQATVLEIFPSRVTSPQMAGPLGAILNKPALPPELSLRAFALRTLLAINPQEGRKRILAEMRQPSRDIL